MLSNTEFNTSRTENERRDHNLQLALQLAPVVAIHPCRDKQALAKRHTKLDEDIDRAQVIRELKDACSRRGETFRMPFQIGSSRSPETIARWANEQPDFVPAIACGAGNFLLAVDCDRAKKPGDVDGLEYFQNLAADNGFDLSKVPATITQSGGMHFFFANPDRHTCAAPGFADKNIQLRGEDGYVIAPGAIRTDGKTYTAAPGHPDLIECAASPDFMVDAPQWLLDAAGSRKRSERSTQSVAINFDPDDATIKDRVKHELACRLPAELPEGVRRQSVLRAAFIAGDLGLYEDQAIEAIEQWYAERSETECPEAIDAIVRRSFNSRENAVGCSFIPNWSLAGNIGAAVDEDEVDLATTLKSSNRLTAPKTGAFKVKSFDEILAEPLANFSRPVVKGLIREGDFVVMYGPSNSGKSFLALDMAWHVAAGDAWCGRKTGNEGVLYLAFENPASIHMRLRALRVARGGSGLNLHVGSGGGTLTATVKAIATALSTLENAGRKIKLIILDTLAAAMEGDENSSADMRAFIQQCLFLTAQSGAALIAVHHTGKDSARGARGWSGLRAAADVEISIESEENGLRLARTTKRRDDGGELTFAFTLEDHDLGLDEDGEMIRKAVANCQEISAAKKQTTPKRKAPSPRGRHCLAAIRAIAEEKATVPDDESDVADYGVPVLWVEAFEAAREPYSRIEGAELTEPWKVRKQLVEGGWIRVDGDYVTLIP